MSLGNVCFTGSDIGNGLSKKFSISFSLFGSGDILECDVNIFERSILKTFAFSSSDIANEPYSFFRGYVWFLIFNKFLVAFHKNPSCVLNV